ncbi:hypothetical protein DES49_3014 [Halospina denitrificans]|uniref:Uncharacterized protein n=1 Tax=Halospina denitrificans TaxID=332522 RepID=A0A4R7JGW7_9GAMM|nr:hypothetical protein [Halospina denitrificans]TDT37062.1 hypothetical protein DES49_3014 [Halospina denitrificans]
MDDWQIDVAAQTAHHSSGLQLSFEGKPRTKHFSGTPIRVPDGMQSLELVRLIREGYQAFENAWPDEDDDTVAKASGKAEQEESNGVQVRHRRPRRRLSRSDS